MVAPTPDPTPATGLRPWDELAAAHAGLDRTALYLVVWTPLETEPSAERFGTLLLAPRSQVTPRPWAVAPLEKRPGSNAFTLMVTLGRAANNDIVLAHPAVSKFHAYARRLGDEWLLSDAGSSNGTEVDGVAVRPPGAAPLRSGTRVLLGGAVELQLLDAAGLERLLETDRPPWRAARRA